MTEVIKSVESLKSEIEKTRQNLTQTAATIKKITGRDVINENNNNENSFNRSVQRKFSVNDGFSKIDPRFGSDLKNSHGEDRRRISFDEQDNSSHFQSKHRLGPRVRRHEDDEDDEDDSTNHKLASSVVATSKDMKSRDQIIQQQGQDEKATARNRRMFGLLMGTLNQFRVDEKRNERQERKRKEIEKKLDEKEKEEKEKLKKEKNELFMNKKQQQIKLRRLEMKMDIVKLHEEWEEQSKQLMHFIRTEAKPSICYLPKVHNDDTQSKLDHSRKMIEEILTKRRSLLDVELNNILNGHVDEEDDEGLRRGEDRDEGPPAAKSARLDRGRGKRGNDNLDDEEDDIELNKNYAVVGVDYQNDEVVNSNLDNDKSEIEEKKIDNIEQNIEKTSNDKNEELKEKEDITTNIDEEEKEEEKTDKDVATKKTTEEEEEHLNSHRTVVLDKENKERVILENKKEQEEERKNEIVDNIKKIDNEDEVSEKNENNTSIGLEKEETDESKIQNE